MPSEKAKPARPIYHCTICGEAMPWAGGRLRLICDNVACHGERPRPSPIEVREGDEHDRLALMNVSRRFFGSSHIHAFDEVFPLARTPFLVVEFSGERAGYMAYALNFPENDEAAVVLLVVQPGFQGRGVGTALQGALEAVCRPKGVTQIRVSSTNDNIPGLYFYQRVGYVVDGITLGAAAQVIAEHGEVEAFGFGGIPIRDEIQLIKKIGSLEPTI